MSTARVAARAALGRLGGREVGWVAAAAALVAASGVAGRGVPGYGSDPAVAHAALGVGVPLLAFALLRALLPGQLDLALYPWARHGVSRRRALVAIGLAGSAVAAGAGMFLAVLGVATSRVPSDPQLAPDLVVSAGLGALGGAAYFAWVLAGARLGAVGPGLFVAVDWVLGAVGGATSLAVPRGPLRALAVSEPILDLPLYASAPWLAGLGLVCWVFVLLRTPP
ncbi:MAG: hypothetical protein IT376_21845 [Polyangiaceae bacterium]|nr:hypothetical protein [Polyangiaceae bacterium]